MSFVKRAVKKVFKVTKRALKKTGSFLKRAWDNPWVRTAIIVAASLFVGGFVSGGGWSGFTQSIAANGGGVSGFFTATGQTIASGFNGLVNGVKQLGSSMFGTGTGPGSAAGGYAAGGMTNAGNISAAFGAEAPAAAAQAAAGGSSLLSGAAATAATSAASSGVSQALAQQMLGATNPYAGLTSLYQAAPSAAPTGFFGKLGNLLVDPGWGGTFLRQGIAQGVMSYYAQEDQERQEWYWKNRTVWGGPAFGGSSESSIKMPTPHVMSAEEMYAQQQQQNSQSQAMAMQGAEQQVPAMQGQGPQQGLLAQDPMLIAQAQAQAANGIPAQNTQPPPATQPPQGRTPGLLQLETMGVA